MSTMSLTPALFRSAPVPYRVSSWQSEDSVERMDEFPHWLDEVIQGLGRLGRPELNANDCFVSQEAVWKGLDILAKSMGTNSPAPSLVPGFDGSLQMEWHRGGVDLEIFVEPNGKASAWCEAAGEEWHDDERVRIRRIKRELSRLSAHA